MLQNITQMPYRKCPSREARFVKFFQLTLFEKITPLPPGPQNK